MPRPPDPDASRLAFQVRLDGDVARQTRAVLARFRGCAAVSMTLHSIVVAPVQRGLTLLVDELLDEARRALANAPPEPPACTGKAAPP